MKRTLLGWRVRWEFLKVGSTEWIPDHSELTTRPRAEQFVKDLRRFPQRCQNIRLYRVYRKKLKT